MDLFERAPAGTATFEMGPCPVERGLFEICLVARGPCRVGTVPCQTAMAPCRPEMGPWVLKELVALRQAVLPLEVGQP